MAAAWISGSVPGPTAGLLANLRSGLIEHPPMQISPPDPTQAPGPRPTPQTARGYPANPTIQRGKHPARRPARHIFQKPSKNPHFPRKVRVHSGPPVGRRAFWPPSAARLLGVPSLSGTPSSRLLDGCQKSRRRNPAITRTGSYPVTWPSWPH